MSPRFHTFCENFHVTCKYLIALPIKIHQVNCYFIQSPKWLTLSEWQWNWYNHTMSLNGKYSHRIAIFTLRHFLRFEMNHSIHCIEKWNEMKWCHIFNQYLPVVCWTQTKRQFFSLSLSAFCCYCRCWRNVKRKMIRKYFGFIYTLLSNKIHCFRFKLDSTHIRRNKAQRRRTRKDMFLFLRYLVLFLFACAKVIAIESCNSRWIFQVIDFKHIL